MTQTLQTHRDHHYRDQQAILVPEPGATLLLGLALLVVGIGQVWGRWHGRKELTCPTTKSS